MARNRVQFQPGYSLVQFMDEYGTEEKCTEALFRWRWPNGFVCPRCEHSGHWRHGRRALYQCRRCRHQVSLTAGTILASTKLSLRTWFLAMYLMRQTKNGVSALELSRQLSVSYNTAWKVKHKLMQVMKERDDTRPLGGWVLLDDAYWGGERRGGKTGRGAPGKTPFVAAVELNREGRPMRMRLSRVGGLRSEEIATWARCHLEPGTVVVSDALGCFAAVQCAGCFHHPFVTGQRPASGAHLGQHHPGQHQALVAWHLSPPQLQASAALPRRVLLPVQSSLLAARDVSPPRLRRPANCPDALPNAQTR